MSAELNFGEPQTTVIANNFWTSRTNFHFLQGYMACIENVWEGEQGWGGIDGCYTHLFPGQNWNYE